MNRQTYKRIDASKFLCSLFIVLMHCFEIPQGEWLPPFIIQCFAQQAVPFFFLTSGFFLGKKIQNIDSVDKKIAVTIQYSKKLLYLYLVWMVLWLPKILLNYVGLYGLSFRMLLIVLRRIILAGEGVYWYVLVLAESALIVGTLFSKKHKKMLMFFIVLGLTLSFSYEFNISIRPFNTLNNVFYYVFSWSNNFIMKGVPFFAIGVLISEIKNKHKSWLFIVGYIMSSLVNVSIFFIANRVYGIFTAASLMYPLQAIMLFLWSLDESKDNSKRNDIGIQLRERSAVYYFLHTVFVYGFIDPVMGIDANIALKYGLTVGLCELSYWCIKSIHIKKINWLVNIKG